MWFCLVACPERTQNIARTVVLRERTFRQEVFLFLKNIWTSAQSFIAFKKRYVKFFMHPSGKISFGRLFHFKIKSASKYFLPPFPLLLFPFCLPPGMEKGEKVSDALFSSFDRSILLFPGLAGGRGGFIKSVSLLKCTEMRKKCWFN